MKTSSLYLRSFLAIISLAGLAACGGKNVYTLGGAVYGLDADATGMELANGGETVAVPVAATSAYSFPKPLDYGNTFHVTVKKQPRHMTCTPGVPSGLSVVQGTAGTNVTNSASFVCSRNAYSLGGTITGLTEANKSSLILVNGSSSAFTLNTINPTGATGFYFNAPVADGATYGVTVLPFAASVLNCTVANGVGVMGEAVVTNVQVTCVPK
jgi:hypothetical protein